MKKIYVDFHVLQTVPPSCVNRDDTGSPKTAIYGGVTRARVSSQSWKHAMREKFRNEQINDSMVGERTKKVFQLVKEEIEKLDPTKDAEKLTAKIMKEAGFKADKSKMDLEALFFISSAQVKALAKCAVDDITDKKILKEALQKNPALDMILFGRMVASDPSLNYDAAAQVAHSISTHAVQTEFDYFTAVDDCAPEDNAGAGHLGTVEYSSSTLYRYATVNTEELVKFLDVEDTSKAVKEFAKAFILSMPTGKQNTFANRTLPDAIYVTLRSDQPVNLCGAFEKAIPSSSSGFVEASKKALCSYTKEIYGMYSCEPEKAYVVGTGLDELGTSVTLQDMLSDLESDLKSNLSEKEVA